MALTRYLISTLARYLIEGYLILVKYLISSLIGTAYKITCKPSIRASYLNFAMIIRVHFGSLCQRRFVSQWNLVNFTVTNAEWLSVKWIKQHEVKQFCLSPNWKDNKTLFFLLYSLFFTYNYCWWTFQECSTYFVAKNGYILYFL